jgi:uncharacterized protein YqgC (DUF456 family)
MSYVILSLFILFLAVGILLVSLGLPGTWLIVADALLYSLLRDYKGETQDWKVVLFVAMLALAGEAIEFGASVLGARREKVPTGAIVASIAGGLLGAVIGIPVFLIGSVLGLLLGTYLGALIYSLITQPQAGEAFRFARSVLFSRVVSIFAKTTVAVVMSVYLLFKVF